MLRVSHIPNGICILRIILVGPIVFSLLSGEFFAALILIFVAGLSDGLDGFLAKTFDWRTRLGGLLDPLADKILLIAVFLTLTYLGLTPAWLTVVVIGRDAVIIAGAITYNFRIGAVQTDPTLLSKVNTGLQLLYMLAVISNQAFSWSLGLIILLIGAGVLNTSFVSGLDYVLRWSAKAAAHHAGSPKFD